MSVDQLVEEPKSMNIRDLTVEKPEKENSFVFDPRVELTPEERTIIRDSFTQQILDFPKHKEDVMWNANITPLQDSVIVLGEDLSTIVTPELWTEMRDFVASQNGTLCVNAAGLFSLIQPHTSPKESFFSVSQKESIRVDFRDSFNNRKREMLYSLSLADPEFAASLTLTEAEWQNLIDSAKHFKEEFMTSKQPRDFSFIREAAQMRLLAPEKYKLLNFDDATFQAINNEIQELRRGGIQTTVSRKRFIDLSASLAILTAKKAEIKKGKVELSFSEPLDKSPEPLPVARNF